MLEIHLTLLLLGKVMKDAKLNYKYLLIFTISGKRPVSMLTDNEWDLKSHPYLDPTGENNLNAEREVPLRNVQYIEQRIKNVNPAYATTISILFAFLNFIDMKQLTSRINMSVMRGTKRVVDGMTSYGLDDAFQVFDNVTGTPR